MFYRDVNLHRRTVRSRLAVTEKWYIALAPKETEVWDWVCVLYGGQLPFVIRGVERHFELIWEAYLHGIMDGEALKGVDVKNVERDFEIW